MSSERHFRTKLVNFRNRKKRILLQNENGPCPLLAIFNVLILRGDRFINQFEQHKAVIVSSKDLSVILANRLMAVNKKGLGTTIENLNRNVNDSIDVIPRMVQGLDINVKFDNIYCFEYTPELGLFDVLRIPLVHAWVVDPEDTDLCSSIGTLSYNQAVEKQIHMQEVLEEIEREKRAKEEIEKKKPKKKKKPSSSSSQENRLVKKMVLFEKKKEKIDEAAPKNIYELLNMKSPEQPKKNEQDWVVMDKEEEEKMGFEEDDDDVPFGVEMEVDGDDSEESEGSIPLGSLRFEIEIPHLDKKTGSAEEQQQLRNHDEEEDRNTLHNSNIDPVPFPLNHIDHSNEPLDDDILELERKVQEKRIEAERSRKEREKALREGRIVKEFLSTTSDQMTYYGIEQLHTKLKKGRLYVLFRNHHFSTILKHKDGYIYMLCNDVGYVNKPGVVWERLTDQEFFDGDFRVYVERKIVVPHNEKKKNQQQQQRKNNNRNRQQQHQQHHHIVDIKDTSDPRRRMKDGVIHKVVNIPGDGKKQNRDINSLQVGDITIIKQSKKKKKTKDDSELQKKKFEEEEIGLVLDPIQQQQHKKKKKDIIISSSNNNNNKQQMEEMDAMYARQLFEEEMRNQQNQQSQKMMESDFQLAKRLQLEEQRRVNEQIIAQRHFDALGTDDDPKEGGRNFNVQHPRHNNNNPTNNPVDKEYLRKRDEEIARSMGDEETADAFRQRVFSKMKAVREHIQRVENPYGPARQKHLVEQHMKNQRQNHNNPPNKNKNKNKKNKKNKKKNGGGGDETKSLMFQEDEEEEILLADSQKKNQRTKRQKKEDGDKCSIM